MEELETPAAANNAADLITFTDDFDSACSTPFVSAPSSPGRGAPSSYGGGFFYSAPASPIHFMLSSSSNLASSNKPSSTPLEGAGGSFEFESSHSAAPTGSMTSADELFLNGQIRPMKLSSHLQRPQVLAPLLDVDENEIGDGSDSEDKVGRGRDLKFRDRSKSLRRRARSMSPLRTNNAFQWLEEFEDGRESTEINEIKEKLEAEDKAKAEEEVHDSETPASGASSRSSSVGRSSKRWVFLKEFLYRSKSEGRNSTSSSGNHKFWRTSLSFSPSSNKKSDTSTVKNNKSTTTTTTAGDVTATAEAAAAKPSVRKAVNGVGMTGKRRVARSAHELHYTTNRAQAEEMRKKTYLPYKQGLLGCLGFSSKSYGAMNGFARALNPVSSRRVRVNQPSPNDLMGKTLTSLRRGPGFEFRQVSIRGDHGGSPAMTSVYEATTSWSPTDYSRCVKAGPNNVVNSRINDVIPYIKPKYTCFGVHLTYDIDFSRLVNMVASDSD